MAGLRRTKVSSSGISIPIGGSVNLLHTTETVTQGGEVFLRTGVTSNASTYPSSPTKNYIENASAPAQFSTTHQQLSPWSGDSIITPYGATMMVDNNETVWFVDSSILYRFAVVSGAYVQTASLNISSYVTGNRGCVQLVPTNASNSGLRGKLAIFCNNQYKMQYFDATTLAHYHTATISASTYAPNSSMKTRSMCFFASSDNYNFFVLVRDASYYMTFRKFNSYNGAAGGIILNDGSNTIRQHTDHGISADWLQNPVLPKVGDSWSSGTYFHNYFAIKNYGPNSNAAARLTNFNISSGGGHSHTSLPAAHQNGTYQSAYYYANAPFFIKNTSTNYTSGTPIRGHHYTNASGGTLANYPLPLAYNQSLDYAGTQTSANGLIRYHGVLAGVNKVFPVTIATGAVGTAIDISSQAAPFRFTADATHLYNLNGTNVHKYAFSNGAFVSTADISAKVSGSNATGIAYDGAAFFYILDKSNSAVHKYNASWAFQSTVTLGGTPHSTQTLKNLAIVYGRLFVGMDSAVRVYALDGTDLVLTTTTSSSQQDVEAIGSTYVYHIATQNSVAAKTASFDVVGVPSGGIGATQTTYYRVN